MGAGLPLDDLTVIELGHSVAAPFAAEILGDLGADVYKIEKRDGDDARHWAPPYLGGQSAIFQSYNRNKRSIAVDLRSADDNEKLRRFILERADIVLQNLRPGTAEGVGLGAAALRVAKPELIYCNIGAYGATGPYKDRPGYDPLMQAFGGLMSVTGHEGQEPVRVGASVVDLGAGMWAVIGILSALVERNRTGIGRTIDASLLETALTWTAHHSAVYQSTGVSPQPQGTGVTQIVPYKGYATRDGFIVIAAGNDKLFALLAKALGRPEWSKQKRFATNPDRVANQDELYGLIKAIVATRNTAEWELDLNALGVPCAPMQTIGEVLAHPQVKALGMLQKSPEGDFSLLGLPLSFDGVRPGFRIRPPTIGQHTDVLDECKSAAPAE